MKPRDCLHIVADEGCAYCQWKNAEARVAELEKLSRQFATQSGYQKIAGARDQCVFCGLGRRRPHQGWCPMWNYAKLMPDQSGEGGSPESGTDDAVREINTPSCLTPESGEGGS